MTALQPRTREAVLAIAAWQAGVLESPAGSNKVKYNTAFYGREVSGNAYPWCMAFIWWVFREAGFNLYKTASCSAFVRRYKAFSPGQIVTSGFKPGDIVFFDFSGGRKKTEHVGLVSHVLGIGLAHAYEVAHRRDFPTITLGSRIIVPRDKFMEWIDEQAAKKSEIF